MPKSKFKKNIILDIDGTLIADLKDSEPEHIVPRPYIALFLDYIFTNFKNVAIWTAATEGWARTAMEAIMTPKQINKLSFIWTRPRCNYLDDSKSMKPLDKVFRVKKYKDLGFDRSKTIILEDTLGNAIKNEDNFILVPRFKTHHTTDTVLKDLIKYFETKFMNHKDITKIDKTD